MKACSEYNVQYSVRNFETDFKQRLKPSAMLGYFQEAAAAHSVEMGMGFDALRAVNRYWVLSKICVRVLRRPVYGETVAVRTRPHEPSRAIYERSFFLTDANGNEAAAALSRWCVLDAEGRIVPAAQVPHNAIDLIEDRAFSGCDWRIGEADIRQAEPAFTVTAASSDYDQNMHVNNIKYADFVFDCFSVEELLARKLRAFSLHYVRQAFVGDKLVFYRAQESEDSYRITGRRGEDTVVAARVEFDRVPV